MTPLEASKREGLLELREKSLKKIQTETAIKWTGRAAAAASMGLMHDAIEYAHEGIEHAALSGNLALLRDIREFLLQHQIEP